MRRSMNASLYSVIFFLPSVLHSSHTPLIVIGLLTKFCVRVVCPSECGLVLITPPLMDYLVTISKGYLSPTQFQDESVSTRFTALIQIIIMSMVGTIFLS